MPTRPNPAATRRAQLERARLYFISDAEPGGRPLEPVLRAALAGGVAVFQLRDKRLDDESLLAAARLARALTQDAGALFVVNDRPDLALAADADGVHVGQDDASPAAARALIGDARLVGVSTHSRAQIEAAGSGVDYIAVGPVHATPTKPGRPPVGVELVRAASALARVPFFAVGGIDADNAAEVVAAGGERVAVVRAIAEADDPRAAAERLRSVLERAAQPGAPAHRPEELQVGPA